MTENERHGMFLELPRYWEGKYLMINYEARESYSVEVDPTDTIEICSCSQFEIGESLCVHVYWLYWYSDYILHLPGAYCEKDDENASNAEEEDDEDVSSEEEEYRQKIWIAEQENEEDLSSAEEEEDNTKKVKKATFENSISVPHDDNGALIIQPCVHGKATIEGNWGVRLVDSAWDSYNMVKVDYDNVIQECNCPDYIEKRANCMHMYLLRGVVKGTNLKIPALATGEGDSITSAITIEDNPIISSKRQRVQSP